LAQFCRLAGWRRSVALLVAASAATLLVAMLAQPAFAASEGVLAWGLNDEGELGDGTETGPDYCFGIWCGWTAEPVTGIRGVVAVSSGGAHTLALLSDGTVVAWGSAGLGNGGVEKSDAPLAVSGLGEVTAISAGHDHSLALLGDGTVMAWGYNGQGQLGDGGTESSDVPVAVSGLAGVKAIAAGATHSLALLSDGTVMAWGEGYWGQLGDGHSGNGVKSTTPRAVKGLSEVTAIAAGTNYSLALLSDGAIMAWGSNGYGQLGVGNTENSDVPMAVDNLSGATAISAGGTEPGGGQSLALLNNGTVMAWGDNESGQLGIGTEGNGQRSATPLLVHGLTDVTAVSAGGEHSLALVDGGSVMAWGSNRYGQLGTGYFGDNSDIPVDVVGPSEIKSISAGGLGGVAAGLLPPTITNVAPEAGPLSGGTSVILTGTNLSEARAVMFGGTDAASFAVEESGTAIVAVSPPGTGSVSVTVSTPAGTSIANPGDQFSYIPAPTVTKLKHKKGPSTGGTTVIITGTNFGEVSAVDFGTMGAASFTVTSKDSITAVSPPGVGTEDVTVTTPGGVSATSVADRFKYGKPVITGVSPDDGPMTGGTTVTITGGGFLSGQNTIFKFGKTPAREASCSTTTTCILTSPAATKTGAVSVTATVAGKSSKSSSANQFTYN
jgi:alpha-tubulin suppressor-like RCC1 family protein